MNLVKAVLGNRCPACFNGRVFRGFYSMNRRCSECGFVFEKEPGYFLGALVTAYFISAFSLVPTLLFTLFYLKLDLPVVLTIGTAQLLVMNPFLFRYSKLIWIHWESHVTRLFERE